MYNTTAESISGFITWASQRIAKEVEENERVEQEANTREFIPGSNKRLHAFHRTKEEKIDLIGEFDFYRDRGAKIKTIAMEMGISESAYRKWRKELNLPKYKKPKAS